MYTLQQSINSSQTYIQYVPLTAGVDNEPAISIGNTVLSTILTPPFTWPFNRNEFAISLIAGQQDYVFDVTDFAYLEKVSLLSTDGNEGFEIKSVYNINSLGIASDTQTAQPNSASVKSYIPGTSVSIRFLSIPDQAYTGTLTYQMAVDPFTALDQDWAPLPDEFLPVYNNLFLAEAMAVADDAREQTYRLRGIAALLAKSTGLSDLQVNAFLAQYIARGTSQEQIAQLRNAQGSQARGV